MKGSRLAIVAFATLAAAAYAGQDPQALRRTLVEGSTETYSMETEMKTSVDVPNMGPMDMTMKSLMSYALKFGKADEKGIAPVEVTIKMERMSMDSPMGDMSQMMGGQMPPTTVKGTIDGRNRLSMQMPGGGMAALMQPSTTAGSLFVEFPEAPVKVGDKWDMVIPKGPMFKEDQKLAVTLEGTKDVDGRAGWVVSYKGTIKMDLDFEEMMKTMTEEQRQQAGQMKMQMSGTMDLEGQGVVDQLTGQTLRMTSKIKMANTMEMVDMGVKLNTNGDGWIKVELKK